MPLASCPDPALPLLLQMTPATFKAAIALLWGDAALERLVEQIFALHQGPVVPEASVAAILCAAADDLGVKADIVGEVRRAFRSARRQVQQPRSGSAASAAGASFGSSKVPLQPLQRANSGIISSPIAALCRGQETFQGVLFSMEPAPLVHARSGASTVGWQDSAGVGSPASSYHSSGSAAQLLGGLSRQLSPSPMQLDSEAAHADAARPGSSAVLAGDTATGDGAQVHLDADMMAQLQAGLGLSPASAAASANWWQSGSPSFSRSVEDDLHEVDSLGSAWGSSSKGSQVADSGTGSAGYAEEELMEAPGSGGIGGAQGRDHLATKAENNRSSRRPLGWAGADPHSSLAVPLGGHSEAAAWQGSPDAGAAEEQRASKGNRASLSAAWEADDVTVLESGRAGALRSAEMLVSTQQAVQICRLRLCKRAL